MVEENLFDKLCDKICPEGIEGLSIINTKHIAIPKGLKNLLDMIKKEIVLNKRMNRHNHVASYSDTILELLYFYLTKQSDDRNTILKKLHE